MKLLIISTGPAQLQACLESAAPCLPNTVPFVVFHPSNQQEFDAYQLVMGRFNCHWFAWNGEGAFNQAVVNAANTPKFDGSMEQLVMLCPDTMVFLKRIDLRDVWRAMKDATILGVNLWLSPSMPYANTKPRYVGYEIKHTWRWEEADGLWRGHSTYGIVYRTSDVLGPLYAKKWDSIEELRTAFCADAGLRRRPRMACLAEPSLIDLDYLAKTDGEAGTARILAGECVAIQETLAHPERYHWKAAEEFSDT